MLDVSFVAAFFAGFLSFVSPCVLPIVPPYLVYMTGIVFSNLSATGNFPSDLPPRFIGISISFVLGFVTMFVAFGVPISAIGQAIGQNVVELTIVAGITIIIAGLNFLGVFRRATATYLPSKFAAWIGAYVIGLAFAFGWTPCIGPTLAKILFVASAEETVLRGSGLLSVYALGIGVPFILIAAFASLFLKLFARIKKYARSIERIMGVLLILTGLAIITGQISRIAQWLLDTFPAFGAIG